MEHLSESLCVSLSTCFCIDNSENNRSKIIKLEYIVEHEKFEKFDIGHCQDKVQARRLKLSMYVYQIIIYLSLS